jgi:hypothetical protein
MPETPDSEVVRVIRAHRLQMNAAEDATTLLMAERWLGVERALDANISALANEMVRRSQAGEVITESMVHRANRYQVLKAQMQSEINKYNKDAVKIISAGQSDAVTMGINTAQDAIYSSFPSALSASFNKINVPAVNAMIGFAGDGSPLSSLLKNDFGDAAKGMLDALISGVAQGQGADKVSRMMAEGTGLGLDRSLLIARTEINRSYRAGTTEQYRASGVVSGFRRLVSRDESCAACLILDGEFLESEEELDDHPNGRCVAVPILSGEAAPEWQLGKDWLSEQPEARQREILGNTRFDMWKSGTPLESFAGKSHSNEWGDAPMVIPIKDLK